MDRLSNPIITPDSQNFTNFLTCSIEYPAQHVDSRNIAYDITQNCIWASLPSLNRILKINAANGNIIGNYVVGNYPTGIVYDITQNAIWVANHHNNSISKVNASNGNIIGTYASGILSNDPYFRYQGYLSYDVTQNCIWFTNGYDGRIVKVNAINGNVIGTYQASYGSAYFSSYDITQNCIWVIDTAASTLIKINAVNGSIVSTVSFSLWLEYSGAIVYDVAQNCIWVIDGVNRSLIRVLKINAINTSIINKYEYNGLGISGSSAITYDITQNCIWVKHDTHAYKINAINGDLISNNGTLGSNQYICYDVTQNAVWGSYPNIRNLNAVNGNIIGNYSVIITLPVQLYYTMDGTTPSTNSNIYTNPLNITVTTTVKAIAVLTGYYNSYVSQKKYTKLLTRTLRSDVVKNSLGLNFVVVKDEDNIICMQFVPEVATGHWRKIGTIANTQQTVRSLTLVEESYGTLLCMVQLDGETKRYRSKSQGATWLDVTSELEYL